MTEYSSNFDRSSRVNNIQEIKDTNCCTYTLIFLLEKVVPGAACLKFLSFSKLLNGAVGYFGMTVLQFD